MDTASPPPHTTQSDPPRPGSTRSRHRPKSREGDRAPIPHGVHTAPASNSGDATSSSYEYEGPRDASGGCPAAPTFHVVDRRTGEVEERRGLCDYAGCPICGPVLQRRHLAHFCDVFEGRAELKLVTLTLDPATASALNGPREQTGYLAHAFGSLLRPALRRRLGAEGELRYVWATERHASGYIHLHAVVECPIPPSELRELAFQHGFGVVMDVTPITGDRGSIASAVKYITKAAFAPGRPRGEKAIRTSRGIGFYSAAARGQRRAYVERTIGPQRWAETAFEMAEERRPVRTRPSPRTISSEDRQRFKALRARSRRAQYVERAQNSPYGIRHSHDPATGAYRADWVRIERVDGASVYVTLETGVALERQARLLAHTSAAPDRNTP